MTPFGTRAEGIGVGEVDTFVEHADVDLPRGAGGSLPGFWCVDVGVWRAAHAADRLAGILERPLVRIERVVALVGVNPVRLGVLHRGIGAQAREHGLHRRVPGQPDELGGPFTGGARVPRQRGDRRGRDRTPRLTASGRIGVLLVLTISSPGTALGVRRAGCCARTPAPVPVRTRRIARPIHVDTRIECCSARFDDCR